jgi:hypothetical protein
MVSRATSAAKAASRVAYIGTTESRALPARNSERVSRFGKGSAENARYLGKCMLCACPHIAAYSIQNSGKARPGNERLCACPHIAAYSGILGIARPEGHGFSRAAKGRNNGRALAPAVRCYVEVRPQWLKPESFSLPFGTTESRALPARNRKRVFRFGRVLRKCKIFRMANCLALDPLCKILSSPLRLLISPKLLILWQK